MRSIMDKVMMPAWQAQILMHFIKKDGEESPIVLPMGTLHAKEEKSYFHGDVKIGSTMAHLDDQTITVDLPEIAALALIGEPFSRIMKLPPTGNDEIDAASALAIIEKIEDSNGKYKLTITCPEVPLP